VAQIAHHIAIIVHDFATGGSERIAIRLANRWAESGRRVTLICGTEAGAARDLVGAGVEVLSCTPNTPRTPWSRMQLGWRMAKLIRTVEPDIVVSPGNFHLIILAFLARQSFSTRPIFVSKLSNPIRRAGLRKRLEPLADAAIRFAAAPVDALVAMSPSLAQEARAVFGGKAIVEISEPILADCDPDYDDQPAVKTGPVIICAARLAPQKNLFVTLRAFAELPRALDARLLILGEGPLRSQLEREVDRLGIGDRVSMVGHVRDIGPFLVGGDLYLMTSHYEGYPAVLIEAMAAGLPIVTTNCSVALPEILASPDLGSVVNSHDPVEIAQAIEAQLEKQKPCQNTAATVVNRHRIGESAAAYTALFDQLVTVQKRAFGLPQPSSVAETLTISDAMAPKLN
jgi:glycosyltransferase involved in cell wall biosynthesis